MRRRDRMVKSQPERKRICIPPELYRRLERQAKRNNVTIDEYVDRLVLDLLQKLEQDEGQRQSMPRGNREALSRRAYAIARIRKSEMHKLRRWLDKGDQIEVATDEKNGQVYLFSASKMLEHHIQRQSISGKEQLLETGEAT
jgi:hypothetical protein